MENKDTMLTDADNIGIEIQAQTINLQNSLSSIRAMLVILNILVAVAIYHFW